MTPDNKRACAWIYQGVESQPLGLSVVTTSLPFKQGEA